MKNPKSSQNEKITAEPAWWNDSTAVSDKKGPSKMAEAIAVHRCQESMLPEDLRLFSDPYAIRFIDPAMITWARDHPDEVRAMAEESERKIPGGNNVIRGRTRYFDDIVQGAKAEGFTQIVIIGAGYDTRAYRIASLKGGIQVFEIDRPETIGRKIAILKNIFGTIPEHVTLVAHDIGQGPWWPVLESANFSPSQKTLFLLEGLVMYLARTEVEELFAGIAEQAADGSAVLFDFISQAIADGSSDSAADRAIRDWLIMIGEPLRSGFADGEVIPFLTGLGYSGVQVTSSLAFKQMYFTGKRADRTVSGWISLAYAVLPGQDDDRNPGT